MNLSIRLVILLIGVLHGYSAQGNRLPQNVLEYLGRGKFGQTISRSLAEPTEPHEYPSVVSIQAYGRSICAGAIITENVILTSATCCNALGDLGDVFIVAGDYNLDVVEGYEVSISMLKYNIHPGFDEATIQNDICTITLSQNLQLDGDKIDKLVLRGFATEAGTKAVQIAWDYDDGPLQKVRLEIITDEECEEEYGNTGSVVTSMMCGNEKGDCLVASGSPLICQDNTHCGIASWAYGCGSYPAVYTETFEFYDWIMETTKNKY